MKLACLFGHHERVGWHWHHDGFCVLQVRCEHCGYRGCPTNEEGEAMGGGVPHSLRTTIVVHLTDRAVAASSFAFTRGRDEY